MLCLFYSKRISFHNKRISFFDCMQVAFSCQLTAFMKLIFKALAFVNGEEYSSCKVKKTITNIKQLTLTSKAFFCNAIQLRTISLTFGGGIGQAATLELNVRPSQKSAHTRGRGQGALMSCRVRPPCRRRILRSAIMQSGGKSWWRDMFFNCLLNS